MERFTPRTVLASTTGGDVTFSGLISALLSGADVNEQPDSRVVIPVPGEPLGLQAHAKSSETINSAKP